MARLKEEADMAPADVIMRYIRIFSELTNQIRFSTNKRVMIEIALVKLCKPSMETDSQSLLDRIRQIEDKIASGIALTETVNAPTIHSRSENQNPIPTSSPAVPLPKAIPEDIKEIVRNWDKVLTRIPMPMRSYLRSAKLSLTEDEKLLIVVEDGIASEKLIRQSENQQYLEEILSETIGKEITVEIRSIPDNRSFDRTYPDLSKIIKMNIEIED